MAKPNAEGQNPPDETQNSITVSSVELKAFELWATEAKTADWLLGAVQAKHNWVIGQEITKAVFDKAVSDTLNHQIGGA